MLVRCMGLLWMKVGTKLEPTKTSKQMGQIRFPTTKTFKPSAVAGPVVVAVSHWMWNSCMWKSSCEICHVKFIVWNLFCEICHVKLNQTLCEIQKWRFWILVGHIKIGHFWSHIWMGPSGWLLKHQGHWNSCWTWNFELVLQHKKHFMTQEVDFVHCFPLLHVKKLAIRLWLNLHNGPIREWTCCSMLFESCVRHLPDQWTKQWSGLPLSTDVILPCCVLVCSTRNPCSLAASCMDYYYSLLTIDSRSTLGVAPLFPRQGRGDVLIVTGKVP